MQHTAYTKRQGLLTLVTAVLKACFTENELELMRLNGVDMNSVIASENWHQTSRAEAQKMLITLLSRWPLDDKNDLAILFFQNSSERIVRRDMLGKAGKDRLVESITEVIQGTLDEVLQPISGALTGARKISLIDPDSGSIETDVNSDMIETHDTTISFANPRMQGSFLEMITLSGRSRWSDI
jgi:hypothetical protein